MYHTITPFVSVSSGKGLLAESSSRVYQLGALASYIRLLGVLWVLPLRLLHLKHAHGHEGGAVTYLVELFEAHAVFGSFVRLTLLYLRIISLLVRVSAHFHPHVGVKHLIALHFFLVLLAHFHIAIVVILKVILSLLHYLSMILVIVKLPGLNSIFWGRSAGLQRWVRTATGFWNYSILLRKLFWLIHIKIESLFDSVWVVTAAGYLSDHPFWLFLFYPCVVLFSFHLREVH